ncbi:unnamed protein product [Didymodactylos carnosus]|uniref:Uncharacterized protein n=1 Tax=Didymodactylos carnosus TaxID=1234261 RepID=A0A8S2JUV5_9BILA|nr:unnamed protein product [Didymodactylos carnosus]CAF3815262.1 unnamed protein product [Didymodactylos carnosus]
MIYDYPFLKDHSYSLPPSNVFDEKRKSSKRLRGQTKSAISTSSPFRSVSVDRNSSDKENTSLLSFSTTSSTTMTNTNPTTVAVMNKRIRSSNRTSSSTVFVENKHLVPTKRQRNKSSTLSSNIKKNIQMKVSPRTTKSKQIIDHDYHRQQHSSLRRKTKTATPTSKVDKQQPPHSRIINKKKYDNSDTNQNWMKILGFKPDDPSSPSLSIEERVKLRRTASTPAEQKPPKKSTPIVNHRHTRSSVLSTNDLQQANKNRQKRKSSTGDFHSHLSKSNTSVNQDLKQIRKAMANVTVTHPSSQQLKKRKSTPVAIVSTTSMTVSSKKQRSTARKKNLHDEQIVVEEPSSHAQATTSTKLFLSSGLDLNNIILGNRERRSVGNGID